jgi:endo-1,4-beta-xylanase
VSAAGRGDDAAERELDASIRKTRIVKAELALSAGGRPLAGAEVELRQTSHRLLFGTKCEMDAIALANGALSGRELELAEARSARFLELCNQTTLPFYWSLFERERGAPATEALAAAARWHADRGVLCKGHPLCWHTLAPSWLLEMGEDEVLEEQLGRIRRDATAFEGLVDMWDVVNEAVIMPVFGKYENGITRLCRKLGRAGLVKAMFEEARAANPDATLLLNDFNTSPDYAALVRGCLDAGVGIDVVGIQSHMHQGWWGLEKTARVLERFRGFGLPLHFTEITLVSGELMPPEIVDLNDHKAASWPTTPGGEERQAREAVLMVKALVAERAVEAITWWDLCDGAWLGAPGGLLRADRSPKPAFEALKALIKGEWWLKPTKARTDDRGRVAVEGFEGDYEVSCGGDEASFSIARDGPAVSVELRAAAPSGR